MDDIDPVNEYIEAVKQQIVKKIDDRYWHIFHQIDRLLLKERYCLSVLIGQFTTVTAFMTAGLKVGKKELNMSIEEGNIELKRRIRKHVKTAEYLKKRKEMEIVRALAKIS